MSKVKTNKKVIELILVILLLLIIVFVTLNKRKSKEFIKDDYQISTGALVKYYPRGSDVPRRVKYKYVVDSTLVYYRTVDVSYEFELCNDFEKCKDKQYWVIYSSVDPRKSLINLEVEIQELENPKFPDYLDNFK